MLRTQQITHWSWSISILMHNKRRKQIWSLQLLATFRLCTEELRPILRPRRIRLHVFVTSLKRKTTLHRLTPWMTSFISNKWRQLSHIFPALSKLWIIVWHITLILSLALHAKCVRILVCKCWMMTLMHNIYAIVKGWSYLSQCQNSSKFLSVSYLMKTADVIMIFFSSHNTTDHT